MQERKKVCAGTEDFTAFISSNGCYVDKTRFLRPLLEETGDVALFTRPRRFGKTLTMTMLRDFLKVDRENPGSTQLQERLFKGLAVMEDRELCARFMGQHPVLFITLK
ncbi:MAG: AAA family ATPase, partial [Succinivibrio sp.]|nr:AAA family ATPase [Succinivibrio sp.]